MKLKKGDRVKILIGKDSGKEGAITKVFKNQKRVVVDGINMLTKHQRPKKEGDKGVKVKFPAPINVSNAILICPKCGKTTRVGYVAGEKKLRQCKKCKGTF